MVQNIDYAPTLLEAAGATTDWKVHGISLMPLLKNGGVTPADWRKTIYYRYIDGGHGVAQHSAIRTDTHKLLHFNKPRNAAEEGSLWELFDLKNDPQEMTNLAGDPEHSAKLESMKKLFRETRTYYDDTDENVWTNKRAHQFAPEDYLRPPKQGRPRTKTKR